MLADEVELVGVEAGLVGTLQPLAEFDVEDFKAQTACGFAILSGKRQAYPVAAHLGVDRRLGRLGEGRGRWGDGVPPPALEQRITSMER